MYPHFLVAYLGFHFSHEVLFNALRIYFSIRREVEI